ncbi:MAG TPA: hypothetical protein VGT61_05595 [Thermomicrobiales bacterium]|jgi:predicted lipid-binding transport protein (Tim44 family)|nr:hypothetical protein [Thermomicrobiales bacterium]
MAGFRGGIDTVPIERLSPSANRDTSRPVVPFLLGALLGGVAGTVLGSLVTGLLGDAIASLFRSVSRRPNKRQQPPFDLLLQ